MTLQQALRQSSGSSQDAAPTWLKPLARLHLVVITLWGDDRIDVEIITREYILSVVEGLRAVMTVVCELDDEVGGRWRRRLWVGR